MLGEGWELGERDRWFAADLGPSVNQGTNSAIKMMTARGFRKRAMEKMGGECPEKSAAYNLGLPISSGSRTEDKSGEREQM